MQTLDLAIIGGGIAGIAAAVYARRAGLDFLLFEGQGLGGQILFMERVDNFVGLGLNVKGGDLLQNLTQTLAALEIEPVFERIVRIEKEDKLIKLYSENTLYSVRALIIATGASFKRLGLEEEERFRGKGVSYCAVCDGFFFKGKDVVVIGGGNTAVEEALYLADLCGKVFLVHRRETLRAMDYLRQALFSKKNIKVIYNHILKQIKGKDFVEGVILEHVQTQALSSLEVAGVFMAIGFTPNTEIFKGLVALDQDGFILTDQDLQTSLDFVWAAGDCRKRPLRQLLTAASEGAIASLSACRYLKGGYISI